MLKVFLYTLVTITLLKTFSRSLHQLSKIFVVKKFDAVSVLTYMAFHFLSEKDVLKKTEVTGDVKDQYIKDVGGETGPIFAGTVKYFRHLLMGH